MKFELDKLAFDSRALWPLTLPLAQEVPDRSLVQAVLFVQEVCHRLGLPIQKAVINQVLNTLEMERYEKGHEKCTNEEEVKEGEGWTTGRERLKERVGGGAQVKEKRGGEEKVDRYEGCTAEEEERRGSGQRQMGFRKEA